MELRFFDETFGINHAIENNRDTFESFSGIGQSTHRLSANESLSIFFGDSMCLF
jgi:hypothetical protein